MKTYILDTNCLLRFFLHDIPEQYEETKELITQAKEGKIRLTIPSVVIPELLYALEKYYSFSRKQTVEIILAAVIASYIEVENRNLYRATLNLYKNATIDFVDCYVVCKARMERSELFTFDKKLQKFMRQSK